MTVLEELDHIKDKHKDVSREARIAIRALEDVLKDASPEEMLLGVALPCHLEEKMPVICLLSTTIISVTKFQACLVAKTII